MIHDEKKRQQVNIEIDDQVADGTYSNLAMVGHTEMEFILDFIRLVPPGPKARVKSRIILTPEHAKRFMHALQDNLQKYEKTFGKIKESSSDVPPMINMGTPTAQA